MPVRQPPEQPLRRGAVTTGADTPLVDLNQANPYAAALSYAARGWPVFPVAGVVSGHCSCRAAALCDHPAKHPLNRSGLRAATTDIGQIANWWREWPWAGVGIRTGAPSGLVVVDIDPAHGGLQTIDDLVRSGHLPAATLQTLSVRTGGAGHHLFYDHPGVDVPNTAAQLPRLGPAAGIDLRGDGGYIIAPPSAHISGRRYQWEAGNAEPAPLPSWAGPAPPAPRPPAPPIPAVGERRIARYAEAALRNETVAVANAAEGQRNHVLNRAAYKLGTLVGAGVLDPGQVEATLTEAATGAGLGPRETVATIRSGLHEGMANPRVIPVPQAAPTPQVAPPPTPRAVRLIP